MAPSPEGQNIAGPCDPSERSSGQNTSTFSENVKLTYQEQILESDNLEFLIDKNIAIFKDNVKYYNKDIEAFADIVVINLLTKEINIKSKNQKKIAHKKSQRFIQAF